ncbi:hypothetical protein BJ138DRAFT_1071251 [Hygrophoropsis aurantiaca]|uniref:Uncharacterized protein n=1 Tax=Hygrophoropsis aurantiaca TaxID=72124 RepID=A0ACB7ZZU2_9AGAM|nr:hypothetical protein BJ138DRAFT_1071251 [Hygrophoropsis aurantiaca]
MPGVPYLQSPAPIAIVGIAAELPSGLYSRKNLGYKEFFEFLLNKGQAYESIPSDRFNSDSWSGKAPGLVVATQGSFLKDTGMFDPVEFGISVKDARAMALSTRKLIELSFLSLLDAGIDYRGRNVGCYASGTAFDILSIAEPDEFEARGSFAGIPCMIANKVSYHLDLRGPSIPVDTACSSSLTALHLAVQAIRNGECESAVVAGCQLNMRLADFVQYSEGSILAPDGKCKPFDAEADGFSRGEGAVAIVLKPHDDALRDGDHVYGTILGTGINASGASAPAYAPVADAQAGAMRRAFQGTGRDPKDVDFVEMHATGTAAGDPVECNWVGEAFGRETELLIGSVKGNIGHLEITAFLASLCKVCAIFETRTVPPNVNLSRRNPRIRWEEYRLDVPLEPTPLKARASSGKLLISMCSSGIGGANGHVVIESPSPSPVVNGTYGATNAPVLFVVGGLTPRSCSVVAEEMIAFADANQEQWSSISTISGRRTRQMTWRTYAVASIASVNPTFPAFPAPVLSPRVKPPIVFVFSGQGPQHILMGRQLFSQFPAFHDTVVQLDDCHRRKTGVSLIEHVGLFVNTEPFQSLASVWPIAITLPSLAMVQIALYDLLCSFGLRPNIVVGHSAGETSVLYASGAASKEMAMEIAIARGHAMTLVENLSGTMAALACSAAQAQSIINALDIKAGVLEIACFNSPSAVTIAGNVSLVDQAIELATRRGYLARKLRTCVPVHSSLMEHCSKEYCDMISDVFQRYPGDHHPQIPTFSTCTGDLHDRFTGDYFWKSTRSPVLFTKAVGAILRHHANASFVEISPHPTLSSYLQELGVSPSSVVCPMRRVRSPETYHEHATLLKSLGQLVVLGHNVVDFNVLNNHASKPQIQLAPYPFALKHVPYLPAFSPVLRRQFGACGGPLSRENLRINSSTHPEIGQHIINGEPIMPAAGFLEMVLELGARTLRDVQFRSLLALSAPEPGLVKIELKDAQWSIKSWNNALDNSLSRLHVDGYMWRDAIEKSGSIDLYAIQNRCKAIGPEGFYEELEHFAQYGPAYRRVIGFYLGANESLVKVKGADTDLPGVEKYVIHPAILDACIHVVVHPRFTANTNRNIYYLPSRIHTFVLHDALSRDAPFPSSVYAHAILREWLPNEMVTDVVVFDHSGSKLCTFQGLVVERHHTTPPSVVTKRLNLAYQPFGTPFHLVNPVPNLRTSAIDKPLSSTHKLPSESLSTAIPSITSAKAGGDAPIINDVEIVCRSVVDRVLDCGKKVVRILSLDYGSGAMSHRLCALFESALNYHPIYFAGVQDLGAFSQVKPVPLTVTRPFLLHPSDPFAINALPDGFFDIIVGIQALRLPSIASEHVQRLTAMLLPGGFLTLAQLQEHANVSATCKEGPLPSLDDILEVSEHSECPVIFTGLSGRWKALLNSLGDQPVHPVSAEPDGNVYHILVGQAPGLSLAPPLLPTVSDSRKNLLMLPYTPGKEVIIQKTLRVLDINDVAYIWITADKGLASYAGRGLARSLRREFPLWNISFASFDFPCSISERDRVVRCLSSVPGMEPEVTISADYQVIVPRFHASPAPSSASPSYRNTSSPNLLPMQVEVTVTSSSSSIGIYGFAGLITRVYDDSDSSLLNSMVVSITIDSPFSRTVIHKGHLALPNGEVDSLYTLASIAPALLLGGLALGTRYLLNPMRVYPGQIIVTHCDSATGKTLMWLFTILDLHPLGIASDASPLELLALQLQVNDIVFTAHEEYESVLQPLQRGARVFSWGSSFRNMIGSFSDPWIIGDILQAVVARLKGSQYPVTQPSQAHTPERPSSWGSSFRKMIGSFSDPWIIGDVLQAVVAKLKGNRRLVTQSSQAHIPERPSCSTLFDPEKVYLLVGGIGSLGIHLCLWMYENGARQMVLTSRSGRKSLERANDMLALRMLSYLEQRADLYLQLEAVDATSVERMTDLVQGITLPIAGCMLLSGVLSDRSFFFQDAASFEAVYAPKVRAFETVETVLNIDKMDFFIAFSSIATFGNAGQTNYSSANSALEGLVKRYKNAFCIIAPAITDTVAMIGRPGMDHQAAHFAHLIPWAFSARDLCSRIEDGILKLADGPFDLYIPDFDWALVAKHMGTSELYDHLVPISSPKLSLTSSPGNSTIELRDIVLKFLDVELDDFHSDVPFTAYGLDSLAAGRLSIALRPFLTVSQIQLLGDLSLDDINERIGKERGAASANGESHRDVDFLWDELNVTGQALVKLADHGGVPLILIHGAGGNIIPFLPLQQTVKSSLWALQMTPDTPTHSIQAMAQFYYDTIKAAQGSGPYRIGSMSGTSLILVALARIIEENGDEITQMLFLDHFPLLFVSPLLQLDQETIKQRSSGLALTNLVIYSALPLYRASTPQRRRIADQLESAMNGEPVSPNIQTWYDNFSRVAAITYDFIFELLPSHQPYCATTAREALICWMSSVQAPVTTCIASDGIILTIPGEYQSEWKDAGTRLAFPNARVVNCPGNHFDFLSSVEIAELIQTGWEASQ